MATASVKPRVAIGGIVHETHCFADVGTTLADFRAQGLYEGDDILKAMAGTRAGIGGMIAGAGDYDWALLPTLYAASMPGGIVADEAYQLMLRGLLERLKAALPVDGVLLALHGAMVAESQLDVESDILEQVRAIVGPDVPIVVELDMHGNISQRTVELADVLVAFDTNPHIDPHARGVEAAAILDPPHTPSRRLYSRPKPPVRPTCRCARYTSAQRRWRPRRPSSVSA